ncbi:MAG: hypothetical protein ABFC57_13160 [Veillonellales bacterium]
MNISGIAAGHSSQLGMQSQSSSALDALERQKENLQNQIQKVQASKMDSKEKTEKIKELTVEMEQIDQQIMQEKQAEKAAQTGAENSLEKQQESAEQEGDSPAVVLSASLNAFVSVGSQLKEFDTLDKVRSKLTGEINVANSQIKNGVIGGSVENQMATISTDSGQLTSVMFRMGKTAGKVHQVMEHAAKEGEIEAQHSQKGAKGQGENAAAAAGETVSEGTKSSQQEQKTKGIEGVRQDEAVSNQKHQPVDLLV